MTVFHIEVRAKAEPHDVQAHRLAREIVFLPQASLSSLNAIVASPHPLTIHTAQLYLLTGNLSPHEIDQLITQLLTDPVVQEAQSTMTPTRGVTTSLSTAGFTDITNTATAFKEEILRLRPQNDTTKAAQNDNSSARFYSVDVFLLPGVTDTLAESVIAGAQLLGITALEQVTTGRRYLLDSRLSEADVNAIAEALLYNPVIQHYTLHTALAKEQITLGHLDANTDPFPSSAKVQSIESIESIVPIESLASSIPLSNMSDQQLLEISKQGLLSLNLEEMQAIQRHYRDLDREPTDVELETIAQTWSEHCSHKTFKATIRFRELDEERNVLSEETIHGLLKHYLMRATASMNKPWLVSTFSDNAGIVRFTETQDIAFKVETHNHPSAIEPFGGANTGVGGVIRDVLGVSAQPIACTDILCFGPLATPPTDLPKGILSPRRIASGVVNGVRDYGNKMGIPTVNGAILYNEGYLYNPLVFCGCLGILPHGSHPHQVQPGDRIVVLGGRTGRDGIHGATFSSGEMSSEINAQAGTAVQIGAPITEKKVADVIVQARDRQLYSAITDCGAGGFSSAIGEMGAQSGAYVELEKAPLKYQGLAPWEIWLSEAQERMVLAVPPQNLPELLALCSVEEVEASIVGTFTDDARLVVTYANSIVADIAMAFLHDGMPQRTLEATSVRPRQGRQQTIVSKNPDAPRIHIGNQFLFSPYGYDEQSSLFPAHYAQALLSLLSHPNIASKEEVVRRYDHEVQGATVLKPLVGRAGNGPGDAAVLQPILDEPNTMGIVLSNGINPLYGTISPFAMAASAVDEALRNLVAVGGDVERAAILDNFCWGNPNDPVQLGMLVEAVKGCSYAATIFGVPFISGKDSLNNEYRADGQRLPVIPTLLISAVGVIDDASKTIDMSLKQSGNLLYVIGTTNNELLGSHYAEIGQIKLETHVPMPSLTHALSILKAVGGAIREGLVQSCHDLSEGGLAVAAAEMSLAGLLGMTIDMQNVNRQVYLMWPDENVSSLISLFSESPSRFLVEVAPQQKKAFEKYMRRHRVYEQEAINIGSVNDSGRFVVSNGGNILIDLPIADLQQAWKGEQA